MVVSTPCGVCGATAWTDDPLAACPVCGVPPAPSAGPAFPPPVAADLFGVSVDVSVGGPTPPPQPRPQPAPTRPPAGGDAVDQYVAQEFARLARARHQLVQLETDAQAAVVSQHLGLDQRAAELADRAAWLDRRTAELAGVEQTVAGRMAGLDQREAGLAEREGALAEAAGRRAALAAEVADLSRLAADLRPLVERLEGRREELAAKQDELDRRLIEVGRAEVSVSQRMTELDQLEHDLRAEFELREQGLERERAAVAEELRAARRAGG